MKKDIVELTSEQRQELSRLISAGTAPARQLTHARLLLKADQGPEGPAWSDTRIQEARQVSTGPVERVRKRCAPAGVQEALLPQALHRARQRWRAGKQEAYLVALVCSQPPEGFVRWTLRLLSSKLVEWGYVETVSHETARQMLLANQWKPWIKQQRCLPAPAAAAFVY